MKLILVRHGLSEGNINRDIHKTFPDHAIPLAKKGFEQAKKAGNTIFDYLIKYQHEKIRIWNSPYLRTKQTADEIENVCIQRNKNYFLLDRREDVALCEQQFGLFDGLSDQELMEKYPDEFAHYEKCQKFEGRFWARMPLGESRFDVSLRVHQMFGTWQRDLEKHNINTIIVVSHGVTIRAITMRWLHNSVEWFEKEPNPGNCSIKIINDGNDEGYL